MMNIRKWVLGGLCLSSMMMVAQPLDTVRSYTCDFENEIQNLTWHMPAAANVEHKWCIGSAINNGGEKSLYVSVDGGATPGYNNQSAFVVAYADIILRKSSDKYLLSFDWMAQGYTLTENDGLYVFWVPAVNDLGDSVKITSVGVNSIPDAIKDYALPLNIAKGKDYLRGKSTWQAWLSQENTQKDSRLTKGGKHYRLVFAWRSSTDGPSNPAACIDNIVILDPRACQAPKKLTIDKHGKDSLIMSWKRDTCCQDYEVGVYSYEDSVWIINETKDTFFVHQEVPEGFCDFYVRTKCWDTLTSDYFYSGKVQASEFIYYPDNHCVDYITMTEENCYTSQYHKDDPSSGPKPGSVTEDYHFMHEMVDNGSDEMTSRHTHHYSKNETDPRTGGKLKTVASGELCSSRLGNWNNGGEAERAEFKFHVNAKKNPILILKYAVVMDDPGHDDGKKPGASDLADPRFKLDILSKGVSIGRCASADFTSSWVKEGWNDTTVNILVGTSVSDHRIKWKNWTTIGVNLREYDGETLTIQLTTFDCSYSAHFCYAYFVLGCSSDDLDLTGESCSGNPVENFHAPDGFKYRWYRKVNPDSICSREQDFTIQPIDTFVYGVDVVFPEDSNCYFTLEASSQPHVPESQLEWKYEPKDCKHYMRIKNNSDVIHIKRWEEKGVQKGDTTRSILDIDTCYLNWGKLPDRKLEPGEEIVIPIDTSGTYPVKVTTTYKNCEDSKVFNIVVPKLDTATVYKDTLILEGDSVYYGNIWRSKSGIYTMMTNNYQGCEKLNVLDLQVHANIQVKCDTSYICYPQTQWCLPYTMTGIRKGTRYSIMFDDASIPVVSKRPIPQEGHDTLVVDLPNLQPDYYPFTLIFHDSLTGTDEKIVDWVGKSQLAVRYPDQVVIQRWNDVLAVKNADYNDGHWAFTAYQWYKDGVALSGATGSYLYQALDSTSEYQVMLTRDGKSVLSCGYVPKLVAGNIDIPTLVVAGEKIAVSSRGKASWYNSEGRLVDTQAYDHSVITAPGVSGLYLLHLSPTAGASVMNVRAQTVRIVVK